MTMQLKNSERVNGLKDESDGDEPLANFTEIAINTINEVSAHFKCNLRTFKRDGYIRIKEEGGNWD